VPYATAYRNDLNGNLWDLHGHYALKFFKSQARPIKYRQNPVCAITVALSVFYHYNIVVE
jgi:hypothetical protein